MRRIRIIGTLVVLLLVAGTTALVAAPTTVTSGNSKAMWDVAPLPAKLWVASGQTPVRTTLMTMTLNAPTGTHVYELMSEFDTELGGFFWEHEDVCEGDDETAVNFSFRLVLDGKQITNWIPPHTTLRLTGGSHTIKMQIISGQCAGDVIAPDKDTIDIIDRQMVADFVA